MWLLGSKVLDYLNNDRIPLERRKETFLKRKSKVVKEIEKLTDLEIVNYLFSSYLDKDVRVLICDEVSKLSIKTDKPVLYLSLDNIDDSYRYIDFKRCFKYSKEEYFFMKEEMLIASLKDYLMVDRWGVNYYISDRTENFFSSGYAKDKIIDYIKNDSYFDYVIIDFGKKHCLSYKWLDKKIEIERENFAQDLSRERDEDVLRIINFSEFADGNNGYYYIKKCIESFIQYDENIEISMEGEYAQCVEKYIEINKLTFDCYDKRLQIMSEEKA